MHVVMKQQGDLIQKLYLYKLHQLYLCKSVFSQEDPGPSLNLQKLETPKYYELQL